MRRFAEILTRCILWSGLPRFAAWAWRFGTLRWAPLAFRYAPTDALMERSLFGFTISTHASRSNVGKLLYLIGGRIMPERRLVAKLISRGDHVIDVGANVGYYSLFIARCIGESGHITAIEPEPENLIELHRNLERNSIRAEVIEAAAGDTCGTVRLSLGINGRICAHGGVSVKMTTIDALGLESISLLKIDVEGYEAFVLRGARNTIASSNASLFVEVHPHLQPAGESVENIIESLCSTYSTVKFYLPLTGHRCVRGLIGRYIERMALKEIPKATSLHTRETFWAVCNSVRQEAPAALRTPSAGTESPADGVAPR